MPLAVVLSSQETKAKGHAFLERSALSNRLHQSGKLAHCLVRKLVQRSEKGKGQKQ